MTLNELVTLRLNGHMQHNETLFVSAAVEHSYEFYVALDKFSLWRKEVVVFVGDDFRVRVVCKFEVVETVTVCVF